LRPTLEFIPVRWIKLS